MGLYYENGQRESFQWYYEHGQRESFQWYYEHGQRESFQWDEAFTRPWSTPDVPLGQRQPDGSWLITEAKRGRSAGAEPVWTIRNRRWEPDRGFQGLKADRIVIDEWFPSA